MVSGLSPNGLYVSSSGSSTLHLGLIVECTGREDDSCRYQRVETEHSLRTRPLPEVSCRAIFRKLRMSQLEQLTESHHLWERPLERPMPPQAGKASPSFIQYVAWTWPPPGCFRKQSACAVARMDINGWPPEAAIRTGC